MKESKFSEEQIAYALWQADSGTPVGVMRDAAYSGRHGARNTGSAVAQCGKGWW